MKFGNHVEKVFTYFYLGGGGVMKLFLKRGENESF